MKLSKERHRINLENVRRAMVGLEAQNIYPSIERIMELLERNKKGLSKDYVMVLKRKIEGERGHRINSYTLGIELARIEDLFSEIEARLWG